VFVNTASRNDVEILKKKKKKKKSPTNEGVASQLVQDIGQVAVLVLGGDEDVVLQQGVDRGVPIGRAKFI